MRIAVGMDLHKKSAVCFAVYAGEGKPTENEQSLIDLFNKTHRTQASDPEDMAEIAKALSGHESWFLIENSTKTFDTYWVLTNLGCNVVVAQSRDLYRITRSDTKSDMNDSMELAHYMRRRLNGENEFSECVMPSKEWMTRREICRTIFKEKAHLADLKRRTRSHMLLHGIKLSREYNNIFSRNAIREMEFTGDMCLRIFCNEAKTVLKRTDEERRVIEHMFGNLRIFELITSIPGFGTVSGAYLASMIMDINRFRTCNQFTASFGLVPRMRDSADSHPHCSTTHRGDEEMRRLLKQAAFVHVTNVPDSVVGQMYRRLKNRGMAHNEVLIACSRKLLTVVWSCLRNDRRFTADTSLLRRAVEMDEETEVAFEE